jgi:hypothetical protein
MSYTYLELRRSPTNWVSAALAICPCILHILGLNLFWQKKIILTEVFHGFPLSSQVPEYYEYLAFAIADFFQTTLTP